MLARRPDEFGLVPAPGGYRLKDVLKALVEEGRPIRESQLNELNALAVAEGQPPPVIIDQGRISLADSQPPQAEPVDEPPVLLYGFCRRRAHAHVLERGLVPAEGESIVLAEDETLAERIGRRQDADPIIIVVQAQRAAEWGVVFRRLGRSLYLAEELSPKLLQLPPLPKETPDKDKPARPPKPSPKAEWSYPPVGRLPGEQAAPGSFFPDFSDPDEKKKERRQREKAKKQRRTDRRQERRRKQGDF